MTPFKRRKLRSDEPVWVYRNLNLNRAGVWYSIMQRGRVVAHTREITLVDVHFVVREAGRQRVLKTGRKNVHAFVVGKFVRTFVIVDEPWRRATYNPRHAGRFIDCSPGDGGGNRLLRAGAAHLDEHGLRFVR